MTSTVAPAYLAPDYRYVGNDWAGANALEYVVSTPPVLAADGVTVVTPGGPQNLTGCTVTGVLHWNNSRCGGAPTSGAPPTLPTPVGAVVDPLNGIISLSLTRAQTIFPRQRLADAVDGNPANAFLLVEPQVTDAAGNLVTIGLQPLFTVGR